jgi:hypothetical protein
MGKKFWIVIASLAFVVATMWFAATRNNDTSLDESSDNSSEVDSTLTR